MRVLYRVYSTRHDMQTGHTHTHTHTPLGRLAPWPLPGPGPGLGLTLFPVMHVVGGGTQQGVFNFVSGRVLLPLIGLQHTG